MIELIIDIVCRELELNRDVLTCTNRCRGKEKYSDGRLIVTYILRKSLDKPTFAEIGYILGRRLKNGKGDHSIAKYYLRTAEQLIEIGDKKFTKKVQNILTTINLAAFYVENKVKY
jgi:chromosomal replication initiation ATPase DnaA